MKSLQMCSLFSFLCGVGPLQLQEKEHLEVLLRNLPSRDFQDFCSSLLSNHIGGPSSRLHISLNLPPQRQTVMELLVHLGSVLLCGNPLLLPLYEIAFQPANATVSYSLFICSSVEMFPQNMIPASSTGTKTANCVYILLG